MRCENCGHDEKEHQLVSLNNEFVRDGKGLKEIRYCPGKDVREKCLKSIKKDKAVFVCDCKKFVLKGEK